MPRKERFKHVKRIVVKVGTTSVTENNCISGKKIAGLASDVEAVMRRGYQVVIVSSGAISAGCGSLTLSKEKLSIPEKQAIASVGQILLINEYRTSFEKHGVRIGQILLTEDDIKNRRRFLNARHTFETLLSMGIVPVVNENDSVVVKEIKFGDNDSLSAHVATLINADLLILLSDIDGFYMDLEDPEPVDEIHKIDESIMKRAGGSSTVHGTGGMVTKLHAAEMLMRSGEMLVIAGSGEKNVLQRILSGEKIGTLFTGAASQLPARKKWLSMRIDMGLIIIDEGAEKALREGKKSLLDSGITAVQGHFNMGDIIDIVTRKGTVTGKGLINYSADELAVISGKKTAEIKKILGGRYFDEVINRDDMVIFEDN